jgi:hypothetical protein
VISARYVLQSRRWGADLTGEGSFRGETEVFFFIAGRHPEAQVVGGVGPSTCARCGQTGPMTLSVVSMTNTVYGVKTGKPVVAAYQLSCRQCQSCLTLSPLDGAALARTASPPTAADRLPASLPATAAGPMDATAHHAAMAAVGAAVAWGAALLLLVVGFTTHGPARAPSLFIALLVTMVAGAVSGVAASYRRRQQAASAAAPETAGLRI